MEEKEELLGQVYSGCRELHLKIGGEEVKGEILEVLPYSGSLLAEVQGQVVEIELQEEETIH